MLSENNVSSLVTDRSTALGLWESKTPTHLKAATADVGPSRNNSNAPTTAVTRTVTTRH